MPALKRRLRRLEEQHALVMGAINEGVYDWNVVDDTIEYSGGVQRAVGLPPELLRTTADWRSRIHPEDLPRYLAAIVEHFKGNSGRFECEYRYRALDGAWRWARQHGLAIRNRAGRAVRMIGSTGDITELKRTEEALRKTEERLTLASSAATEGIYEWDLASGTLFLTDRAREFFSLPAERLTPAAWNTRVHAEDFPGYRDALVAYFKGRTPQLEVEYRIADGKGSYRWVLDRGIGLRGPDGRVTKLIGALTDMTQRKSAEIELREARDHAQEALAEQTAIAGILKTTSASPAEAGPVFDAILTHASHLCQAAVAAVFLYEDGVLVNVAQRHASPEFEQYMRSSRAKPGPDTTCRRCALERRTIHTPDLLNDPEFAPPEAHRGENIRTVLSVPMIRNEVLVGVITMWRKEVRPFTPRQIALVETFANQAVIAIENVRLFNETREALEQQTATAETLGVVAQSQAELQPVFDAIGRNAAQLCRALFSCVYRFDGELVHLIATHNLPPAGQQVGRTLYPMRPDRSQLSGRAVLTCAVQRVEDVAQDAEYAMHVATAGGWRRLLAVPMQREGKALGVIAVGWRDPGPIPERQVELLKTFADQAVLAIENARLFNETTEALEQQKALAEVLGTLSRSVADTKPVFDLILDSCQRLFEGHLVGMTLLGEDGMIRLGAYQGDDKEAMDRVYPYPLARDSGSGQAILDRKVVHFPDVGAPGSQAPRRVLDGSRAVGFKSIIFAPLLGEGRALGALWVGRRLAGPFHEREIALLRSFADQAVIAIQNARLFREIEEKSRQLEVASRHKSEFLANMSHELRTPLNAIIGFTRIVMRRAKDALEPQQYENLDKILTSGQHLLALINSILDLSKIEAGRVDVHPGHVGLAPLLEQCARTIEPLVKADAVRLVKDFNGALPEMFVDEEKLRQIVINLLSNAAKFTERGTIRLCAEAADGSVSIAVADTGIGIPADKLEAIFEEFEQADASSTRVYGGTGLGLAIARRLARILGGDVQARSTPGAGSTFTLTLPLRYAA